MQILDLSLKIISGKVYYPGDPEVLIEKISTVKEFGWDLSQIRMVTHDATHVNVPVHSKIGGKNLDDYNLYDFIGESILFENEDDIQAGKGIIFGNKNIDMELAIKIVEIKPKFVGLSSKFEFDLEVEKYLLENDIISFERLENVDKLPKDFIFHGVPLKIDKGDGSPIRAYAIF